MNRIARITLISLALLFIGAVICGGGLFIFAGSAMPTVEYNTYVTLEEDISSIKINSDTADVEVVVSRQASTVSVKYPVKKNRDGEDINKISLYAVNGVLALEEEMIWHKSLFLLGDDSKITVTVPSDTVLEYDIACDTGDVILGDGLQASSATISTTTGDLSIGSCTVKDSLLVKVSTGDITLLSGGVVRAGEILLDGGTGDVRLSSDVRTNSLEIELSTGDVLINGESIDSASIDIETATGDIRSTTPFFAKEIELDTGTGDVSIILSGERSDFSASIEVGTGDTNITSNDNGEYKLDISVETGDVTVTFKKPLAHY